MKKNRRYAAFGILGAVLLPLYAWGQGEETPNLQQGIYEIAPAADMDFVLDVKTCTEEPLETEELQLFQPLDVNQQKYYLERLPGERFRLSLVSTGEALTCGAENSLELAPAEHRSGAAALQEQCWILQETGDGSFYFCTEEGLCLTARGLWNGAGIGLEKKVGRATQKWVLKKAWITGQDQADTDQVNPYGENGPCAEMTVMLRIGDRRKTLAGSDFAAWMKEEDHKLSLDREAVLAYVQKLADQYDTQGKARKFHTSYGEEITLYKGNFGWKMDVEETADALIAEAQTAGRHYLEPVWDHKGVLFQAGDDIGDSYVEVDLTGQKVWLYKDGEKLLETDCVTGTFGTERQTPGGVYSIFYMQSPAVLRGTGYESAVTYWMAFNGGIGLHDASWRYGAFGGEIYKTNGSHGCVNLPKDAAKLIYETVEVGYPVVCYN
ncbi:MAG: L,D-transpeptidase family protein [Lachnospiraceae bacterium]|nr:L,D-transpeptidase family protein [Lachnospiraceae bacterium]